MVTPGVWVRMLGVRTPGIIVWMLGVLVEVHWINFGLWASFRNLGHIGILEPLGWALVIGPSEERVKWSFTLGVGQINQIPSYGLWPNF